MWYKPSIPPAVIDSGKISALQLEAIILMCQRHLLRLRGGARAGGVIGDSAGMGKGRELAGLILEYFLSPKARLRQFVWFSASRDLM
jgi:P-loop containing NTP hydrolase pore-1